MKVNGDAQTARSRTLHIAAQPRVHVTGKIVTVREIGAPYNAKDKSGLERHAPLL
jgi:hypothetical protein